MRRKSKKLTSSPLLTLIKKGKMQKVTDYIYDIDTFVCKAVKPNL